MNLPPSNAARLRTLLTGNDIIVAPGIYDGLSASIARALRFDAAYLTGAGIAASAFGLPDIGLLTQTEVVERVRVLSDVLGDIPLIADADTGYGAPLNVVRTVREFERAGAAAIQLEDQAFPKRCGHLPDKELVSTEQFLPKLRAALDSRQNSDTLIIARTDARGPLGIEAAIERAQLYADAGADVIFVEAPESQDEMRRISREVQAPLLVNMVPNGLTPDMSPQQLAEWGYRIAIYPGAALSPAVSATQAHLARLRGVEPQSLAPIGPESLFRLVGIDEWTRIGDLYPVPEGA